MALRRPPTRIELKADDIEEYNKVRKGWEVSLSSTSLISNDPFGSHIVRHMRTQHWTNTQIMREREMAMEDAASAATSAAQGGNEGTNARSVKWSPSAKKSAAAERIGVNRPR
jgi:hypothetical protein